jgi:Spy/CpxP family protein refolding chaperone
MKLLSTRLDLTEDQRQKIRPILDDLHDATVKAVEDEGLSRDERMSGVGDLAAEDRRKDSNAVGRRPESKADATRARAASRVSRNGGGKIAVLSS